jgi:hypothetical protein
MLNEEADTSGEPSMVREVPMTGESGINRAIEKERER